MKKLLYSIIIAGLALASSSCQMVDEKSPARSSDALTVTASIVNFDGTRVSYAFSDPTNAKSGIKPSWVVDDEIFGFDEDGTTFTFSVSSVDSETGRASFDTSGATDLSGTLYAVYYPGKSVTDFSDGTLAVDLSSQSGSLVGNTPVIMCATGTIDENNNVNFNFVNQTAIVGIYKMQVYKDGAPVVSESVTGVTLKGAGTAGAIEVENGVLTLVPGTGDPVDLTSNVSFTTDEDGNVSVDPEAIAPYFAVIPVASASLSIEATCDGSTCKTNASLSGKLAAGKYYYLGKKIYGGVVATIGLTEYETISEAFAEATGGQEIVLQNDCTADRQILIDGKSVTLDLNDKTLTFDGTDRIYVMEDAGLTIRDAGDNRTGKIIQNVPGSNTISLTHPNSSLSINGGKITCVEGQTVATVYVTDGTLTMEGGEITGERVGISMSGSADVTVSDDAIVTSTTSNAIVASAGALTITGGFFAGKGVGSSGFASVYKSNESTATVEISGGYYSKAPAEGLLKEGFVCVNNTNSETKSAYPKQVKPVMVTLTVGGETTYYASVEDAVAAANNQSESCVITLLESVTMGSAKNITNSYGVTLDLNGFTLTHDGSKRVGVSGSGKLTITDSQTGGKIIQTTASSSTITYSSGSLTIAGGTITKANGSTFNTINVTGGTLTVTGGEIANNSSSYATVAVSKGTVTVSENGKVTSSAGSAINVSGIGTLNVTGGEIEAQSADAGNAIYLEEGSGDISISGGYIHSKKATIYITGSSQHSLALSGDCTVASASSNTLYSSSTATEPNSTVEVTGGKYKSGTTSTAVFSVKSTSDTKTVYTVSNCIYFGSVNSSRLASGYTSVDNDDPATKEDYPKKVVPKVTLQIGSGDPQPFATVEAAVTEANNNSSSACLITIYDNLTVKTTTNVINGTGVTLDLNDHTLKFNGTNRIRPAAGGKLIIKDSGTNGTITNTTNTNLLYYTGGELVLESGTLRPYGTSTGVVYVENATFRMEGGIITDDGKNTRALTIGGSNTATVIITGGSISGGNGDNVTVSDESVRVGAIFVNNPSATCTIDGPDVKVTAPNVPTGDNAIRPIVAVINGNFYLEKGIIGNADNTGDTGNMTAVEVKNGTFTMNGGYLYARHHAILFSGSGNATISGGRLATLNTGWSLLRFQDGSTNQLTINGGGFTVAGSAGKMFAGKTTGATVPSTASVSINPVCYFDKSPCINGITSSNVTGTLSQGSYTYDGKSYSFKVE